MRGAALLLSLAWLLQDEPKDTSLMLVARCISKPPGDFYLYETFSDREVKIEEGDKLFYDVFLLSENPELKGAIDVEFNDQSRLKDSGAVDQVSAPAHGELFSLAAYAKGAWYERRIDLSKLAGKIARHWLIACEGNVAGVYVLFFDNIIIERGNTRIPIYENGRPSAAGIFSKNGYSQEVELIVTGRANVADGSALKALKIHQEELNRSRIKVLAARHARQLGAIEKIFRTEQREDLLSDLEEARSKTPAPESFQGTPEEYLQKLNDACHALSHAHPAMAQYTGHLVGHAHIDLSWLWTWDEGIEVTRSTFTQAAKFMEEFPEFKYSQSSACLYKVMEEKYPELFKKIQDRVRTGQWEIVGGRWCEADTNMISGESHARHFLYGQRYFRDKFGRTARVGWEPDTFGHTWQMPQMLLKAGIDTYYFCRGGKSKPLFYWKGPDGSQVIAFDEAATGTFYNSDLTDVVFDELARFHRKYGANDMLWVYGVGNHGGGPTRENIQTALEWQKKGYLPRAKFSTAGEFFDALKARPLHDVPTHSGDLNTINEGCYTTHADLKRWNRDAETRLVMAETASALASRFGFVYPRDTFTRLWRDVLFNHHHDTLPGSSIHASYALSKEMFTSALETSGTILQEATRTLAAQVGGAQPGSVFVLNTLGWKRDALVTFKPQECWPAGDLAAVGPDGEARPIQRTAEGDLIFVAKDLPAFGYRVYRIEPREAQAWLKREGNSLSSDRFLMTLDPATGCVVRLEDRKNMRPFISQPANDLQIHWEEPTVQSAWLLGRISKILKPTDSDSLEWVENGSVRARVRVRRGFNASTWTQDILVYRDLDWVEFQLDVDWREKGDKKAGVPLLRTNFPLALADAKARTSIPFGDIERPKNGREYPALQWVDLSEADYGVALLNDCKHGHSFNKDGVMLSLIRAPFYPDERPDQGRNFIRYALWPHSGAGADAITRRGFEFNTAPSVCRVDASKGELKLEGSFLSIEGATVVPTALKRSEDGPEWILRMYESSGVHTEASVKGVLRAERVTFIEDKAGDADPARVPLRGYQIETLRLRMKE